jgi:hypothetical protein
LLQVRKDSFNRSRSAMAVNFPMICGDRCDHDGFIGVIRRGLIRPEICLGGIWTRPVTEANLTHGGWLINGQPTAAF